jgi:hypothetical protein
LALSCINSKDENTLKENKTFLNNSFTWYLYTEPVRLAASVNTSYVACKNPDYLGSADYLGAV